jgi:hypothetical protein
MSDPITFLLAVTLSVGVAVFVSSVWYEYRTDEYGRLE